MPIQRQIRVTFQREGIHCYPAAWTAPELADVSFLAHPHRHIFHFRVEIEVYHDDRDLEFIQCKRWCEKLYTAGTIELDHKSCEMIAKDLETQLRANYPAVRMVDRYIEVTISEDGENGATLRSPGKPNEVGGQPCYQ